MLVIDAQTGPAFGDDDGVTWVSGIEANLHGKIDADVAHMFGERTDVLRALIGDTSDAIAVDECVWRGVFGVVSPARLGDAAVHDAAGGGQVLTSFSFEFLLIRLLAIHAVPGDAGGGSHAESNDRKCSRRAQNGRKKRRKGKQHGD